MLLALDPGQSDCGVAFFRYDVLLQAAWVVSTTKLENGPRGWGTMAALVKDLADRLGTVDKVCFERMGAYASDSPSKTLTIQGLLAISAWVCGLFPEAEHSCYFPAQWRGSAKGRQTYCAHVNERLHPEERRNLILPPKRFQHNVYAAVGVGLKALGRFEFERKYSST